MERNRAREKCKICKKQLRGRRDKIFCSLACKNYYHVQLRSVSKSATARINEILLRNGSILLEILGKQKSQRKVKRIMLDAKRFNFKYHTHFNTNSNGKTYFHLYDLAWMSFSDDEILIVRR